MSVSRQLTRDNQKEKIAMNRKVMTLVLLISSSTLLGGCAAISLVDAAASTAIGAGKIAVKGTTAAIGAVIPDGEDKKKDKK